MPGICTESLQKNIRWYVLYFLSFHSLRVFIFLGPLSSTRHFLSLHKNVYLFLSLLCLWWSIYLTIENCFDGLVIKTFNKLKGDGIVKRTPPRTLIETYFKNFITVTSFSLPTMPYSLRE